MVAALKEIMQHLMLDQQGIGHAEMGEIDIMRMLPPSIAIPGWARKTPARREEP